MKRKDFLKGLGFIGVGSMISLKKVAATANKINLESFKTAGTCILIPTETAGPYPWNMTTNSLFFRQDITEGKPGLPLSLRLTVVDINNSCAPVANARVDLWHCDRDGNYSEYGTSVGQTFFRGYQVTDVNGQVNFTTIYPGWYNGRATHIHFQVFLNSVLSATSQLAFPDSLNTTVNNSAGYSAHGQNPLNNEYDMVFGSNTGVLQTETQYETVAPVPNGATGGYDAELTVGIPVPLTGVINLEPETGGQFKLGVNYPNPFTSLTTIPFTLTNPSNVVIEIYNMMGKKIFELANQKMNSGEQKAVLNKKTNGITLANGNYVYQLTVENENGTFRQCKVLTLQ